MEKLIDSTFFKGVCRINGITTTGVENHARDSSVEHLNNFIIDYQIRYMRELLGEELCCQFIEYMESGRNPPEEKWEGLIDALVDQENGLSPLTGYIFFYFVRNGNSVIDSDGISKKGTEDYVSPQIRQKEAWNQMVALNLKPVGYLEAHHNLFPEWEPDCSLLEPITFL